MKTFIRIITVLIVVNLITGSFAPAEYATAEETLSVDEDLGVAAGEQPPSAPAAPVARTTGEANVAKGAYDLIYNRTTGEADNAVKRAYNYIYAPYKSSVTKKQAGGAGAVLVIPSVEMKAEELAAIMEDLSVMSRIFDKKVTASQVPGILGDKVLNLNGKWYKTSDYFDYALSPRDKRVTEAIYLGGFGAMFLTSVDFPLSPPPEVKEKKTEEGVDTVWSQTKQEIYSPEEVTAYRRWGELGPGTRRNRQKSRAKEYDAEKVEELKRKLTKALKHAANIRGLKGNEWVSVVVRGSGPAFVIKIINGKQWWEAAEPGAGLSLQTFLTIRAKKSDIDEFAKNELDDAEFRKRTQIITY